MAPIAAGTSEDRSIDTTQSRPKLWSNADGDRAPILGQYDLFREESDFTLTSPPLPHWIVSVIIVSAIIVSISTVAVAVFTTIVVAVATKVLMGGMALGIVLTASQSAGPLNGRSTDPTKSMSKLWSNVDDNPIDESGETKRHFVNPTQCMSKLGCGTEDEAVDTSDKIKRHFVNPTQCMSKLGCGMDDGSSDDPASNINTIVDRSVDAIEPRLSTIIHHPKDQGNFAIRGTHDSAYHHAGLVMLYALFVFLIALPFIYFLFFARKHLISKEKGGSAEDEIAKAHMEKSEHLV